MLWQRSFVYIGSLISSVVPNIIIVIIIVLVIVILVIVILVVVVLVVVVLVVVVLIVVVLVVVVLPWCYRLCDHTFNCTTQFDFNFGMVETQVHKDEL